MFLELLEVFAVFRPLAEPLGMVSLGHSMHAQIEASRIVLFVCPGGAGACQSSHNVRAQSLRTPEVCWNFSVSAMIEQRILTNFPISLERV